MNNTVNYPDLFPKIAEFVSSTHGTFIKTDHILGHKLSFNTSLKTVNIQTTFFSPSANNLEINNKKIFLNPLYMCKVKNTF